MRILVGCEESQVVTEAFTKAGHYAMSCDLNNPGAKGLPHYQGDVFDVLYDGWDLGIFFPPCTYLSYAGNRHWNKPGRAELREEALCFFTSLYNAPIDKIAIENPSGYASRVFKKYDQIVHPYYFGDDAMKRTCFWLKNLPLLIHPDPKTLKKPEPIYILKTNGKKIHHTEASHGSKVRSTFWPGIARAMAEQWGHPFP